MYNRTKGLLSALSNISERRILFLFFVFGPLPASALFLDRNFTFFYQAFVPESVLWACGYGLQHPREIIAPLYAFLSGEVREFSCSSLGPLRGSGTAGLFAALQPYMTWSTAILWRLFGVSYHSLLPLVYVLYGAYTSGSYALSRLFLGRRLAITAAIFLAASPLAVSMVAMLRDFSKAPFFILAIVFLIKAIRASDLRNSLLFAVLAGTSVGIGVGFRSDLFILLPIGALVLAVGARSVSGAPSLQRRMSRVLVSATFVLSLVIVSAPVWMHINTAAAGGNLITQGATEPFRVLTGLRPAGYAMGWAYSDELTLSAVAAAQRLIEPDWDAREMSAEALRDVTRASTQSTVSLLQWADMFAGDFLAQAIKSSGWILGLPAFMVRANQLEYPMGDLLSSFPPARLTLGVYSLLGKNWFIYFGSLGMLTLLWKSFIRSRREALCLLVLLGFLIAYPAVQLSTRHIFHLEFIWVIGILSLISVGPSLRDNWRELPRFATYGAGFSVFVAFCYLVAEQYQSYVLSHEVAKLLMLERQPVPTQPVLLDNGDRLFEVGVPALYQPLIEARPDSMTPDLPFQGLQWDVRAAADRLLLHVSGESCQFQNLKAVMKYSHTPRTWQPLDAELVLLKTPKSGMASLLFPAFYRPTQHFQGVVVPKAFSDCRVVIERIVGVSRLPLMFTANIEGKRILGRSYKAIGNYDLQVNDATVTRRTSIAP